MKILFWLLYALSFFIEIFEIAFGCILGILGWIQFKLFKTLGKISKRLDEKKNNKVVKTYK